MYIAPSNPWKKSIIGNSLDKQSHYSFPLTDFDGRHYNRIINRQNRDERMNGKDSPETLL